MKNTILRSSRLAAAVFAALLAFSVFTGCPDMNRNDGGDPAREAAAFSGEYSDVLEKTPDTVTAEDEAAVDAALAAYEKLDADAKALLAGEKAALDNLKSRINAPKDAAAFKDAHAGVLEKTAGTVTAGDEAAVNAALAAYDNLSDYAKAELDAGVKARLDILRAEIAKLGANVEEKEAAGAFKDAHAGALAKTAGTVTPADREAIEAALAAYNALGETEKALLAVEKTHLDDLKARIDELTGGAGGGKAGVTLVDPFTEPASLSAFTLKRAAGDADERRKLTLNVTGVTQITWYVDTVSRGSSAELTLSAWDYTPGKHYVSVEFMKDGKAYDASLVFTVVGGGE
jgi:hypothetical protein